MQFIIVDGIKLKLLMHTTSIKEGEQVGGILFSNQKGAVTLGNRTFLYDQRISDHHFGGGLSVANQTCAKKQTLTIPVDGVPQTCVWDHTAEIGWWWYRIRPILEIHDTGSDERYWFQYRPTQAEVGVWCRLTPLFDPPPSFQGFNKCRITWQLIWDIFPFVLIAVAIASIIFGGSK